MIRVVKNKRSTHIGVDELGHPRDHLILKFWEPLFSWVSTSWPGPLQGPKKTKVEASEYPLVSTRKTEWQPISFFCLLVLSLPVVFHDRVQDLLNRHYTVV